MNISDDERFHELAHKALANEAQPAEQAELQALIAENPKLKEEFEQMGPESAAARDYLHCISKKVVIVDAPKGTTSSSTEENLGFWIDEATKIVTLADGKKLNVGRFDDRWISAVSGDVSYELDRQSGNLAYAGSTMKDGIATTIIGAGRCTVAAAPAR